jgi:hypothetical protein
VLGAVGSVSDVVVEVLGTATIRTNQPVVTMTLDDAGYTVAELRARAGDEAFLTAGQHIVDMDGPHEDDWSLYTTITLDDGQELETILHHRAGKPLGGDCSCPQAHAGAFCCHLVWVGLVHLGLDAPSAATLAADLAPAAGLRPWLTTLSPAQLIDLVIEAAQDDHDYRRRLHLRAQRPAT